MNLRIIALAGIGGILTFDAICCGALVLLGDISFYVELDSLWTYFLEAVIGGLLLGLSDHFINKTGGDISEK